MGAWPGVTESDEGMWTRPRASHPQVRIDDLPLRRTGKATLRRLAGPRVKAGVLKLTSDGFALREQVCEKHLVERACLSLDVTESGYLIPPERAVPRLADRMSSTSRICSRRS